MGALVDVVGPWAISPLLEPLRDRLVVFEGIVKVRPYPCFYQPVMDPLFSVVPLSPVSAQLSVSLLQVLFIEGHLPQAVDVGLDADVVEVPQLCVN